MVDQKPTADEQKEHGNKAFADKEYEKAIEHYTNAIEIDPQNHVYYSNRSACYSSLNQWESSTKDAEQCINLSPSFIKGYYRLATAQLELGLLEKALTTVKKGLASDIDNTQLLKLQRTIKQKKVNIRRDAAARKQQQPKKQQHQLLKSGIQTPNTLSATANKEVYDLQQQFIANSREHNILKASLTRSQREQKVNSITSAELEKLENNGAQNGEIQDTEKIKMYRGIGKMFMLSDQVQVMQYLREGLEKEKKKELDMTSKMEYLEKKMTSQQNNIQELIKSS